MVNATRGILIECDPALREFILYLEEEHQFGVMDLDETHVLLLAEESVLDLIREELEKMQEENFKA